MAMRGERALAVVGAMAIAVLGFDGVTYAATGSSLILGKVNRAGTATTVQNTGAGPALNLVTRSTASPPFTTNAKGRVPNLFASRAANADKLAGHTYAQTVGAARTEVWSSAVAKVTMVANSSFQTITSTTVPAGRYVVNAKLYSVFSGALPFGLLCNLSAGANSVDFTNSQSATAYSNISLMAAVTLTAPTVVSVQCFDGGRAVDVWATKLVATKVAAIH